MVKDEMAIEVDVVKLVDRKDRGEISVKGDCTIAIDWEKQEVAISTSHYDYLVQFYRMTIGDLKDPSVQETQKYLFENYFPKDVVKRSR